MVHAEVERANLVTDDIPELALAVVARWCDGEATDAEVQGARREVLAAHPSFVGTRDEHEAVARHRAVVTRLAGYVGGGHGVRRRLCAERALAMAWTCLRHLKEAEDAARVRVDAVYATALRDAEGAHRNGGE